MWPCREPWKDLKDEDVFFHQRFAGKNDDDEDGRIVVTSPEMQFVYLLVLRIPLATSGFSLSALISMRLSSGA